MKNIILSVFILAGAFISNAQPNQNMNYKTFYSLNYQVISTVSVPGLLTSVNINVQNGKRNLEIGPLFSVVNSNLTGLNVRHRVFLTGKFIEREFYKKQVKPFVQYSLLYHTGKMSIKPSIIYSNAELQFDEKIISVFTVEHYFSYGIQFRINNQLSFESSLGLGIYMNSQKMDTPSTFGIKSDHVGLTNSVRMGIGYRF